MAAWHFKTRVLPLLGLKKALGAIPTILTVERPHFGDAPVSATESSVLPTSSYWIEFHRHMDIEKELAALLPKAVSWSESAQMFGDEIGSRLEVWKTAQSGLIDDIVISYSMSALDADFVFKSLGVIASFQCVLLAVQSGCLFSPDLSSFVVHAKASSAARYDDIRCLELLFGTIRR